MAHLFGFIGCGNMGGALARAVCRTVDPARVVLTNRTAAKAEALAAQLGCHTAPDNAAVAREARFLFLGVKPQMMPGVLRDLAPVLAERAEPFVLVSMAAGLRMDRLLELAQGRYPLIRIMPDTPVAVGEGIILYTANELVSAADLDTFRAALSAGGLLDPLEERLLDAGSAVAGCGGAFADVFLEALADGAVACGLPRAQAMRYAAQMLLGSARLALDSGRHPGALKDEVCSPGGSTIQGVRALERGGFRSAVFEAVTAAYEKTVELGK